MLHRLTSSSRLQYSTVPMLKSSVAVTVVTLWLLHSASKVSVSAGTAQNASVEYKFNILAFGDGITEGYYQHGMKFHPYSIRLQELLDENLISAKIHERGESGERVLGGMDGRLRLLLKQEEEHKVKIDWVIIMAGGDDIRKGSVPTEVYRGLEALYTLCAQHGARVLALTVLENVMSHDSMPDARSHLNDLIRDAPKKHEFVTVLDVEKQLSFPLSPKDLAGLSLWDDGQHLTRKGYDKLADIIFQALRVLLQP